ncbi:MAG: tryptophan halogenase family protein [Dokdonella sp.]|uniref:tryptophan halogenase family protein n=1 Tax=Dokdonella sp. TaxID=2291710 RepID=UPI003264518D
MADIKRILIVGGGTAGWLTANYLARSFNSADPRAIQIELVESPDIGILGVGEGTFPSIRGTLSTIGIDEARFLREANATFKQGIRFVDWVRPAGSRGADHYFHPFSLPSQRTDTPELLPYWLLGDCAPGLSFAQAVTLQKSVVDASRAPKRATDADYQGRLNYAYHFDAVRFAALLAAHGRSLGVHHRIATVDGAERDESGAIARVITREAGALTADLYIDCTGFRAELIGKTLGSPFRSAKGTLFVDRAVAIQVPYQRADTPIPSCTISTAHEAGWTWDIGLQARRGVGYVYSTRHTDDTAAETILRDYIGPPAEGLSARLLKFETGFRPVQWRGNCVSVGLSAGFVEPLESSGIGLIEIAAYLIAHLLPADGDMTRVARHFNESMTSRYERVIDFIKMHYCLSQRRDSQFWVDNVDPASVPESLRDRLAMWRSRPPHRLDFVTDVEMFMPASWQFILYGMEYPTNLEPWRAAYARGDAARRELDMIRTVAQHATADLPDHRALVDQVCASGFVRDAKP